MNTTVSPDQMELLLHGDCACESKHVHTVCTVEVVALFSVDCESFTKRFCRAAENNVRQWLAEPLNVCGHCVRPLPECWAVRPI